MNDHTPGPWTAVKPDRNSSAWRVTLSPKDARGDICNVLHGLASSHPADTSANARLIAAAPDLLEALRGVLRVADRATVEFDFARSAITKATQAQP